DRGACMRSNPQCSRDRGFERRNERGQCAPPVCGTTGRAHADGDRATRLLRVEGLGVALLQSFLQLAYRGVFDLGERLGVHVTPNHFYWPIPDTRRLPKSLWTRPGEMPGLDLREDEQLKLLEELARFRAEYDTFPRQATGDPSQFHLENERFCAVDAELYYAF